MGLNMSLLNIFKNDDDSLLAMPCDGKLIDITEVKDPTFSSKMMGDGFAVVPTSNVICSPCDGKLSMVFKTKHAFGIKMKNGMEVLVHIGIDTVNLNGNGFTCLKEVNKNVKKGTPIVQFDSNTLKDYDKTVMVIITNDNDIKYQKVITEAPLKKQERVIAKYEANKEDQ